MMVFLTNVKKMRERVKNDLKRGFRDLIRNNLLFSGEGQAGCLLHSS
jgi:hypothetical protein